MELNRHVLEEVLPIVERMISKEKTHLNWLTKNNAPAAFTQKSDSYLRHFKDRYVEYVEYILNNSKDVRITVNNTITVMDNINFPIKTIPKTEYVVSKKDNSRFKVTGKWKCDGVEVTDSILFSPNQFNEFLISKF